VIDERGSLNYPQPRPTSAVIDEVLNSEAVRAAMRNEIDALTKNAPSKKKANYVQPAEAVEQRAQRIVKAMFATQDEKVVSGMGWLFRKIWKRIYENVLVCRDNISEILEAAKTGPIVYLPTHRSYIDFLLCSYVTYFLNMPIVSVYLLDTHNYLYMMNALFARQAYTKDFGLGDMMRTRLTYTFYCFIYI
jgi:glycerone phosphate O-acyltransferase/fatty acyl-CoA reductase